MTSPSQDTSSSASRRLGQVAAVAISTLASLAGILAFALDSIGASDKPAAILASRNVSWVRTMPGSDTASALGDTVRFAATVADLKGSVLNAAPVLWTTSDSAIATVDARGQVVARGPGIATITATAGTHAGQSRVIVRQRVAAVAVLRGDSLLRVAEGASMTLAARAADTRGHPVTGRRTGWRALDTTVVAIDSTGALVARAVGRTLVVASIEGSAAEVPVEVRAVPASLAVVGDTTPRAAAGQRLPRRVAIRVLSRRGEPARDVPVRWIAASGAGVVEPVAARTDAQGMVSAAWTLGPRPGRQQLAVAAEGLDSALVVVAEAEPVAASTRWAAVPADLVGRVREPMPVRALVRLVDTSGVPLAGVPVSWSAEQGGSVDGADARTDSLGEARAAWTLGPRAGRQRLRVQAGSAGAVPPQWIAAVAGAGPAAKAILVSGARQTARAGSALPAPIRIRVQDAHGNVVAGTRVVVLAAAGSVGESIVATDSAGLATVTWTLGRAAGQQQLLARPEGVEPALAVDAFARPRAAANVEAVDTVRDARAGGAVKVRFVVRDEYGNAVPDARVRIAPASGGGSASPRAAVTDAEGMVVAAWTLGRAAGEQALEVLVPGTEARATLAVDAAPPRAEATRPAPAPTARAAKTTAKRPAARARSR